MSAPNPTPTPEQDVAHVVRLAARWPKLLAGLCSLLLAGATGGATVLYQRQRQADEVASLRAEVQAEKTARAEMDGRMRKFEAQIGIQDLILRTLETMGRQLSTVEQAVARLDGYFQALPRYRGLDDERADASDRTRDRRATRPRTAPATSP